MDTESVYRQLREQIVSGVYRAGDRLPEVSLSAALAVSRTPVREALRRLESDGLVDGSGRGVTVTAMSTPDLRHAHAVRGALDALAAELAADRQRAGRLAPAALSDLETQAGQLEQITAAGDLEQAADLNRRFHSASPSWRAIPSRRRSSTGSGTRSPCPRGPPWPPPSGRTPSPPSTANCSRPSDAATGPWRAASPPRTPTQPRARPAPARHLTKEHEHVPQPSL